MHNNTGIKKTLEEIIEMTPEEICSDREIFDSLIYTDIDTAVKELHRRREDPELAKKVKEFFGESHTILEPMVNFPKLIISRNIATPNFEILRFLSASDAIGIEPMILEYADDMFVSKNQIKYFLGKICIFKSINKKGEVVFEGKNVIDFNKAEMKKISEIQTLSGKKLIDFHHDLYHTIFDGLFNKKAIIFNESDWCVKNGKSASEYYPYFLAHLIRNGILFENLCLENKEEIEFAKKIFIPTIIKLFNFFKMKPLIIALAPTIMENSDFWYYYEKNVNDIINKNGY